MALGVLVKCRGMLEVFKRNKEQQRTIKNNRKTEKNRKAEIEDKFGSEMARKIATDQRYTTN